MAGFVPGTANLPQNVALLSLGQLYIDQGENSSKDHVINI
jgi:hypothetical protein